MSAKMHACDSPDDEASKHARLEGFFSQAATHSNCSGIPRISREAARKKCTANSTVPTPLK
jgi:hypothetical protein